MGLGTWAKPFPKLKMGCHVIDAIFGVGMVDIDSIGMIKLAVPFAIRDLNHQTDEVALLQGEIVHDECLQVVERVLVFWEQCVFQEQIVIVRRCLSWAGGAGGHRNLVADIRKIGLID